MVAALLFLSQGHRLNSPRMRSQADSHSTSTAASSLASAVVDVNSLLHLVALRDRNAYRRLYENTRAKLYAVCLRMLRDAAAAQDALQDTYVRIWSRVDSYRGDTPGEAFAWMLAIARSRCLDELRKRKPMTSLDEDPIYTEFQATQTTPETLSIDAQRSQVVNDCLRKLASERFRAISLAFLGGLSYSEVAQEMGRPLGTTKSDIRRGLIELKKCIDSQEMTRCTVSRTKS